MSNNNSPLNMSRNDDERLSLPASPSKVSFIDNQNKLLGVAYGIGMNVNGMLGSGIVTAPGIIWNAVKSPGIVLLLWAVGGETKYLQTAYPNPRYMLSYLFSFMFIL